MEVTLIRHLPTKWNQKQMLQGRRDIGIAPITEDIQKEINDNIQMLNSLSPFAIVLASTLKRTHQTAQAYGYQPAAEGLLDELDFGPFEGRSKEHLIRHHGEKWFESPKELMLGESLESLEKRVILFLNKYKHSGNILVFGHGSWIRAFLSYCQNGDINNMNKLTVNNNQCITLKV